MSGIEVTLDSINLSTLDRERESFCGASTQVLCNSWKINIYIQGREREREFFEGK